MTPQALPFLQEFVDAELLQKENLFKLLGTFKGSKSSGKNTSIASIVRGLCTNNQKILRMAQQCMEEMQADADIEPLKTFANNTVMWFDQNFIVFEKFVSYLSHDQLTDAACENAVLHCKCYVRLVDSITALIRNPFVVAKLDEAKSRVDALLQKYHGARNRSDLDTISFDHVRALNGQNVCCFFTVDQIVKRTGDAVLGMGNRRIELLLLNLDLSPGKQKSFNSLAILDLHTQPRSVIYPPFRVNELSMACGPGQITFSAFSSEINKSFVVSGEKKLLEKWFRNLTKIFPTDDIPLSSSSFLLHGLGINTLLSESESSGNSSPNTVENLVPSNSSNSFDIMKKSLLNDLVEAGVKLLLAQVIHNSCEHDSIIAEYDDVKNDGESLEEHQNHKNQDFERHSQNKIQAHDSPDSLDCFDIITTLPNPIVPNQNATVSLPDLSAPPVKAPPIYINATGSAIDVNLFGKNYNPTFSQEPRARRKSLFSIFKKKSKDKEVKEQLNENIEKSHNKDSQKEVKDEKFVKDVNEVKENVVKENVVKATETEPTKPKQKVQRPDLQIEIPKISAFDANLSQPSSATSTSNRTLPLPFALPSSTSTYFFKPYLNNNSSSTLPISVEEKVDREEISLAIPQELKDMINSEETIDYYMSPISSTALKVSKWKAACAKWELMTVNEKVFVKIASYCMTRSWLLVFKEEHDLETDELVDKPLLILELDETTKARQSSALDIEITAVNAITRQKNVVMIRCHNGNLAKDISSSLHDVMEMRAQKALSQGESNMTLSSSVMSKPSASSTLTSIYTHMDTPKAEKEENRLLLDRMTVRVHQSKELYDRIHEPSSWKTMAMYSLSILHSMEQEESYYHFDLARKGNDDSDNLLWSFQDDKLLLQIERLGKAGLLVRVSELDMYMLECKGRKEFQRLVDLF